MKNYFSDIYSLLEECKWIQQFSKSQGYCIACGHSDPLDLEYHHVGGKKHNPITVSLCRNCHGRISRRQRHWPKVWLRNNNPRDVCDAILLRGYSDLFRVISDKYLERVAYG